MTDQQLFLHALADAPEEDTPFLAYSDWLRERGEPGDEAQAELIIQSIEYQGLMRVELADHPTLAEQDILRFNRGLSEKFWNVSHLRTEVLGRHETDGDDPEIWMRLVWDRGLIVGLTTTCGECVRWTPEISRHHPLKAIRLVDWRGIVESVPQPRSETLPFLKLLQIPRNPWRRWGGIRQNYFHLHKKLPGVRIAFYE